MYHSNVKKLLQSTINGSIVSDFGKRNEAIFLKRWCSTKKDGPSVNYLLEVIVERPNIL